MSFVIGLVGEKGSGKQTFVNFIKEILKQVQDDGGSYLKIRQVRFSDILAQTLILWDILITRTNLQNLAIVMNETFGAQALANAAKFSIEGDNADVIILDGIRREGEYKLVKSMENNLVIYITAKQNLRYERLKERSEKVGEVNLTFEQFLKEEESKAEAEIPKLCKKADLKIDNNGTLEEFRTEITKVYNKFLM